MGFTNGNKSHGLFQLSVELCQKYQCGANLSSFISNMAEY